MINFCIKFLICFTKPNPPPKKEAKVKKASKVAGKKGKQIEPVDPEVPMTEPEEKDENVVNCIENAREWCHIEYSLLKGVLPSVEINVVTWGEAAKVFAEGDCRSVKTALVNDLVWVYFEMNHKINFFTDEDVVKFKDSKITFSFSQDNKKMMAVASSDWPKQFTYCDNSSDGDTECPRWFSELRQVDPSDNKYDSTTQRLDSFKIGRPSLKSIVTMINIKQCDKNLESKIKNVTDSLPAVEITSDLPKKGKGKTDVKRKKSDKKGKEDHAQEDNSQLFLDAGLLISGKYDACAERKEITQSLRYSAVFVNSSKILTDEQDIIYAPFIVSILAFKALPIESLQKLNVNKIFARYELANVLDDIETQKYSIQEDISLDETRVFFLSSPEEGSEIETLMQRPSMMKLAEALLSRRFVVKIYGDAEPVESEVEPCIFGDRPTDPYIATPDHEMFLNYRPPPTYSAEVFIGSACFNLIQLVKGYSVIEACSVLTSSPLSSWDPTCDFAEISDDLQNEGDRKALLSRFTTRGVVAESVFIDRNCRVELKITTTCKLTIPEDKFLLRTPQVSHRAVVIFSNQSCNDRVADLIESTNRSLLASHAGSTVSGQSVQFVRHSSNSSGVSLMSTRLSECRKLNLTMQEIARKRDVPKTIATGFFVEHNDQSILVLEAMTYVIPPLIAKILDMLPSEDCARVLCDSSIFFTQRLYIEFHPILRIKLTKPLDAMLKTTSYYTQQSMRDESLQTLLLLDLLRRCRTLNSACVNQLFPSSKQLKSFCQVFADSVTSRVTLNMASSTSFSRFGPNKDRFHTLSI